MSTSKPKLSESPVFVVGSIVIVFILMLAGAYFMGQRQAGQQAEAKLIPIKKFRAKEGTERENAQALTSSQRSKPEEMGEGTLEVLGSLEPEDHTRVLTPTEQTVKDAMESGTPEEAIRTLIDRLTTMEGNRQKSKIYGTLAALYRALDPPMLEEAERALFLAWDFAESPSEKAEATYFEAAHHMALGDYEQVLQTVGRLENEQPPVSTYTLEIGVMTGVAYEKVGNVDAAKQSYTLLMDDARTYGLDKTAEVTNVYRMAGMNLGMILRAEGNEDDAQVLARRVQADLAF